MSSKYQWNVLGQEGNGFEVNLGIPYDLICSKEEKITILKKSDHIETMIVFKNIRGP